VKLYFIFSLLASAGVYLVGRFTVGTVVLRDFDAEVVADSHYILPAFFAAFICCWLLRPAVRGHTFASPLFASFVFPFFAGGVFAILLSLFGKTQAEYTDFQTSFSITFSAVRESIGIVIRTLPVSVPVAFAAIMVMRRSDPPEAMSGKQSAAPAR
jgi:hypothetical protein